MGRKRHEIQINIGLIKRPWVFKLEMGVVMPQKNYVLSQWRPKLLMPLLMGLLIIMSAVETNGQSETVSMTINYYSSLTGIAANDLAGWDVAFVGDVNKDGFGDLLIGAPANDKGGFKAGAAYLIFGSAKMPSMLTPLTKADVTFTGVKTKDEAGTKVAGVADVNGDGFSDFVIAAPMANNGAGKIYLIFGKNIGWQKEIKLEDADVIFVGEKWEDNAGFAVASVGDVNNDSISDLVISAPRSDSRGNDVGKAYLILGKKSGWQKNISLANADVIFEGEDKYDLFGSSVAGIGDVNKDGFEDIAISAPYHNLNKKKHAGKVYLFFGKAIAAGTKIEASNADASLIGDKAEDLLGKYISNGSDVNGDGFDDFSVVASLKNETGKIYLVWGKAAGWEQNAVPETYAPSFAAEQAGNLAGIPTLLTDLNKDGFSDLLISASKNSQMADQAGKVYFIEGKSSGWKQCDSLASFHLFMLGEKAQDYAGQALAGGDYDGDGFQDVAVGAPGNDTMGIDAGIIYLFNCPYKPKPASLMLTSPNGGENWLVGSVHPITWASEGNIEKVTLKYSTDNGATWKVIEENTKNDGEHSWTVPDDPSITCLVRVEDATDGAPFDKSDQVFTISIPIVESLKIYSPNGGEQWLVGSAQQITWTWNGTFTQVKIEYSIDNGATWNLIDDCASNDGSYDWTVPNTPSNFYLLKISDKSDGIPVDISDAVFSIILPPEKITLLTPNGGECWHSGATYEIKWNSTGLITNVKIQYSIDGGKNWLCIIDSTPNDGSHPWIVPNVHSKNCLIKVADIDCTPEDISDAPLTIWDKALITIMMPNGGECLLADQKFEIRWEACCCLDSVKIQYSIDGGYDWKTISNGTENDGSYKWMVPKVHSTNCLIKVADLDCDPEDTSDKPFTIWGKAPLTLIAPNGGECLKSGQQFKIKWEANCGIDSIKIQYSVDGGNCWTTIVKSTPNDSSYLWTVPAVHSSNCLVKVADLDCDPEDISDSPFTIWNKAPITVLAPNGGECLHADQQFEIKWEASCFLDSLKIQYSINGGKNWQTITSGTENDGKYIWTVPKIHSNSCLIKVADQDCNPEDVSDKLFTIWGKAPVTVLYPNGSECLKPGDEVKIKWQACCCLDSLKIEYSTDGGEDWTMIIYGTENDGTFLWTVPNIHSNNCLIKVADLDCDPEDFSDKPFTVWGKAPITVLSPNGSECLKPGQKYEIKWEAICTLDSVKIQFSKDGGQDWTMIAFGTPNDGSYLWTVPEIHSKNCLIKVAGLDCYPFDVSNKPFSIWNKAPIAVIAPNGGECLKAGDPFEIKWEAACYLDSLKVQYSIDNGVNWINVSYGTPNDGSFLWTIPTVTSQKCLIKVADIDCDPFDISDKPFTICSPPYVTVLQPNGGECLQVGSQYEIKWYACCFIDTIKIQYSIDKGKNWKNIKAKTENDGSFIWTLPNTPSDSCLIKVADVDCDPYDVSDKVFSITPLPVWQVIKPNGGEVLTAGTYFEINWKFSGYQIDSVKVQYSIDGGANWLTIINRTANDGSYVWKLPNKPSSSCLVKVADIDCDPSDVCDGFFTIKSAAVLNFDATIMTGCEPLLVKFSNLSTENPIRWRWYFGDGKFSDEKEPVYTYSIPGIYTVKLIAYYPSYVDSVIKADFIRVYAREIYAQLGVVNSTPTLPQNDWTNAIDGDMYGWDGTTVLQGSQPSMVFSLANSTNKMINSIGLVTDTGIGHEDRWIHRFQIQVSRIGIEPDDFQTVLDTVMSSGAMEVFPIQSIQAKYVKLVVIKPQTDLVHLGEFQVYFSEASPTSIVTNEISIPDVFRLVQNYPNPFNPTTTIRFELPKSSQVRLEIYNVLGEKVKTLFNGKKEAGVYEMIWDGKNKDGMTMPSGVYMYVFASEEHREVKKMILAK